MNREQIRVGSAALVRLYERPISVYFIMDYSVGSRIRVKLYGGKIVEAKITAIVNQSTGRKIRISFGKESVVINPEQIIEVLDST
jgi:hypothetical protein